MYKNLSKDVIRGAINESMEILSESSKNYNFNDTVEVNFNGKKFNCKIHGPANPNNEEIRLLSKIGTCIKYINSSDLWNYLYKYHNSFFKEVNNDPYFDGKKINSGTDLKKSISELKTIAIKNNCIYIAGEYWCDDEHGFSIVFSGGKFIKSKYDSFDYNRDMGKDVDYKTTVTVLSGYDNIY